MALFPRFEDALARAAAAEVVAVDMPIGFQETAEPGGRVCERLARSRLGPRRSSVFATPSRGALAAASYRRALAVNRRGGGPGLSKQCFHLFPKMREIDALMTPALQARVRECHPELAFATLAGAPMAHPKRTREGRAERLAALTAAGLPREALEPHPFPRRLAAPDDLLDAAAVALSARRIARGEALVLPEAPPLDPRGLRMEIVA
jgi:predicted RNase H-like nuclease